MHFVSDGLEAAATSSSGLPLLHIADPTAERIVAAGFRTVGLLGTRFTMEKDFYKARLADRFGLRVVTPDEAGRAVVHDIIYQELCKGVVRDASRAAYLAVIADLKAAGAECLVLGCTEIGLLLGRDEEGRCGLPVFDTAHIHAIAAADWAMKNTD
ncbi:hypothetical protein PG984_009629 [Apiospora sp. TS-2023a]